MSTYDPRFAGYATRVAFDIRLTRPQIFYLCFAEFSTTVTWEVANKAEKDVHRERGDWHASIIVPQMRALISRGLVEHYMDVPRKVGENWVYRPTEAGRSVLTLLKIAGLAVSFQSAANEEKPRVRRAAGRG